MAESADQPAHLLHVLRHAKSSWEEPGLEDHDRPLAPRGRKAAAAVSRYLKEATISPSLVLCSSAKRALQTYEGVRPSGELLVETGLYAATAGEVIERLRDVPESTDSTMVIGHNPTMQLLVVWLASGALAPGGHRHSGARAGAREVPHVRAGDAPLHPPVARARSRSGPAHRSGPARRPRLKPASSSKSRSANPSRPSGGGGSARSIVLGRGNTFQVLHPPCVLPPLDPALASRTRGISG